MRLFVANYFYRTFEWRNAAALKKSKQLPENMLKKITDHKSLHFEAETMYIFPILVRQFTYADSEI